jgi:hypothetical protein
LVGDFKLNRATGLLLQDDGASNDPVAAGHIPDA